MCARFSLSLLFLISLSSVAFADDRAAAREHYQRGTKLFSLGRFDEAIKEYEAAFELRDDPVLLYNIAQAHRLNANPQKSIFFYKSYLSRSPNAANVADVTAKIVELQRLIDQQARTQKMPPDSPVSPDRPIPATPQSPEPPPPAPVEPIAPPNHVIIAPAPQSAAPDVHAGRTKKIAGIVLLGVGVAAIAAGISMSVLSLQAASDINADSRAGRTFDPGKESFGKTAEIVGPVLDGVGAAAAVAGGVVLFLGLRDAKRAAQSHALVVPAVGPGHVGVNLKVSF